tara:strand:+ start:164 stop:826 length:663 start_codon:yes stop_codon:yes gene_type:complete
MRLLELFCGTKSVGKVAEKEGYEVISLDFEARFNATHTIDIFDWDYKQYPVGYFDVIWASPDCRTWSLATGGKYRTKKNIYGLDNKYQEEATMGCNMIRKCIEILKYFQPDKWFIENPRALLQYFPDMCDFIDEYNAYLNLVYYGNYGHGCPKATNIWSNMPLWKNEKKPIMSEDTYDMKFHNYNNRMKRIYKCFGKANAEVRSVIPPTLIERLFDLEHF